MADTIAPSPEQHTPRRLAHRNKMQGVVAPPAMDRELEEVMALARCVLLQQKMATSTNKQAAVSKCRAKFDGIEESFPEAAVSADYYVTRARFEEFVGNHEGVADLYAAAAKAGAKPREVVQDNFIQFLARQSAGLLTPRKTAPSARKSTHASKPRHKPHALPCTSVSEASKLKRVMSTTTPKRVQTPSSLLRGGARRVRTNQDGTCSSPPTAKARSSRGTIPGTPPTAILRIPKIGPPQRVRTPAKHVSPSSDIGSADLSSEVDDENSVRAASKIGTPQRVRMPARHVAPVLDGETEVDNDSQVETVLPSTLQNFAAGLRHLKDSTIDTSENADENLTSAVVFSPVRVPKSQVETTGSRTALTPVRRSPRLNQSQNMNKKSLDDMLKQTKYCYTPNKSVDVLR